MSQEYKAPNGETVIAQDDVQAAAFENAGFEPVGGKPKSKPKTEE
jgi:hypothetical protein